MGVNTYVIPTDRREEVEKLVQRYQRKAARYNVPLEVSMGKPYAETVRYWRDNKVVHEELIEVFNLEITGDTIRNGSYSVVAKLEHLDGGNIVSVIGNAEVRESWRHIGCHCDHCGTNRDRKLTFIVRDKSGSEKQVGKTCLKDYCGIDPNGIGIANELHDVFLDYDINEIREYDPDRPVGSRARAYGAMEVLALAVRVCKKQGYIKSEYPGSNKQTMLGAYDMYHMLRNPIKPDERAEAEAMAAGITAMTDEETAFTVFGNVKLLLEAGYCKSSHFGFFAYAPMAWQDYQQKLDAKRKREEEMEAARKASSYVGEIGQRITVDVMEAKYITSWETQWGMTHLYRFVDTDGNVFVWFASNMIDEAEVKSIKGTVKDHSERDGVKQTVLTRCKII